MVLFLVISYFSCSCYVLVYFVAIREREPEATPVWYLEKHFRFFLCSHWQGVDLSQINLASGVFFQLMVPLLS